MIYIKEKTKALRVEIDRVIQQAKKLQEDIGYGKGGRQCALVVTKLEEGKMWGGKILEEIGSELPAEYRDKAE